MKHVAELMTEAESQKPKSFEAEVWNKLSRIDCSGMVEKKMNLSYLSWASAWAVLMEFYPESSFRFDEPKEFPDGTQEVWVFVTVKASEKSFERFMWLPVLDHQNRPIRSPNAFQINTTRMRCLTKCLAMFGLGHHIYAGEDVPRPELDKAPVGEKRSVVQTVISENGVSFDPEEAEAIAIAIDDCFTLDGKTLELQDGDALDQIISKLKTDSDLKVGVWHHLPSNVRSFIKKRERGE